MIPYFQVPPLHIGETPIHLFEFLLVVGCLLAVWLGLRRARRVGLSPVLVYDLAIVMIVAGFIGAHFMHALAYVPGQLRENPWYLFHFTSGISSFGGMLGGGLAGALFLRWKKQSVLRYADLAMFGVVPAWLVGRIGCFTAHDHPGRLTDVFLAVQFPGGARHDLGFYEAIWLTGMTVFLYLFFRKRTDPPGLVFASMILLYAVPRFFLDFLRATDIEQADTRYAGLTPAQFGMVALVGYAGVVLREARKRGRC